MTTQVNSNLDVVRAEFISWQNKVDNRLGLRDYETVAAKVDEAVKKEGLLTEEMTLKHEYYSYGFSYCYGVKPGLNKFIPVSSNEFETIKYQMENGIVRWPVKNPETNTYFIPHLIVETVPHPSQEKPADADIKEMLVTAESNHESEAYRILEALAPYAHMIHQCCGNLTYRKFTTLFSNYPKEPKMPGSEYYIK